jgi:hypothetical protein
MVEGEADDSQEKELRPVLVAANNALRFGQPELYEGLRVHARVVGDSCERELHEGEAPLLFVPAFIRLEGKCRIGGLLLTPGRLIVGYTDGLKDLRPAYAEVIALPDIVSCALSRQKIGVFAAKAPAITIEAPEVFLDAIVDSPGMNKQLFNMVASVIFGCGSFAVGDDGSIEQFHFDTEHPSAQSFYEQPSVI